MPFDITKSVDIIETMENYLSTVRPRLEIRHQLDIGYELNDQSVILNEIRPFWQNPKEIMTTGYAKATFVKSKNFWKIYWKRANQKWYSYEPKPHVRQLSDFLKIVDQDEYHCFKG